MTGYLLDTDVVSEFSKRSPSPHVVGFLEDTQADLWLSVIVLGELELGVQVLPEGRRRNRLSDWLSQLKVDFDQCVYCQLRAATPSGPLRSGNGRIAMVGG